MYRVLLFLFLFVAAVSGDVKLGVADPSLDRSVVLTSVWSSGTSSEFDSVLSYSFCASNKNMAVTIFQQINAIRVLRYADFGSVIKYDSIHNICPDHNACIEELQQTGCLKGDVLLYVPFVQLKQTGEDIIAVSVLSEGQFEQTPDHAVKFHLTGPK